MQLPKLILGAVIIFWGWQTGLWLAALPMALSYEISFFVSWRWHLTRAHFRQASNLCTILLILVLIYLWNQDASLKFIFLFFRWLPIVCFPLLLAQAYSDSKGIDIRALLFLKEKPETQAKAATFFNLNYPFFAICLISASAGNTRNIAFYFGVGILSAIALWFARSPRTSKITWLSIILLSFIIGFFGHLSLHHAHLTLERKALSWVRQFYRYHSSNPNQRNTAIGDIGAVKLSNRIVLRLKPNIKNLEPQLLRRITYNSYNSGIWVAKNSEFQPLEKNSDRIKLIANNTSTDSDKIQRRQVTGGSDKATVYRYLDEGENLLNLPEGTQTLDRLPVNNIEQNQYSAVRVESEIPQLAAYEVTYNRDIINDSKPTVEDLKIPKSELSAIRQIAEQLNLKNKTPEEVLKTVHQFFNTEFDYSLKLVRYRFSATPLEDFLLEHRSGHCEYFATATALLLREVGIPTRYAIGYSVHEYSSLEKQFIIRGKNAHAWNLVYINGAWQEFDTTPSDWRILESSSTSKLVLMRDFFSWISFNFSKFSELIKTLSKTTTFWLITIPILALLVGYLLRKRNGEALQLQRVVEPKKDRILLGIDSEIYLIERALNELGIVRQEHESWQQWVAKIQQDKQLSPESIAQLQLIIHLHYRYRFDPQGIDKVERVKLKQITESWLEQYQQTSAIASK